MLSSQSSATLVPALAVGAVTLIALLAAWTGVHEDEELAARSERPSASQPADVVKAPPDGAWQQPARCTTCAMSGPSERSL